MARPSIKRGFVPLALDLFAAAMCADIPNADRHVLCELLLWWYGPEKLAERADGVRLDPAELEARTGIHRNNVRRAIRSLVAAAILVENLDGTFALNKNWETWSPRGEPIWDRRDGRQARYCIDAAVRFRARRSAPPEPPQRPLPEVRQREFAFAYSPIQDDCPAIKVDCGNNQIRLPSGEPPRTPHRGSACAELRDGEEKREEGGGNPPPPLSSLPRQEKTRAPELTEALDLLRSDELTRDLADVVEKKAGKGAVASVAGWQWWVAARRATDPDGRLSDDKRSSWGYLKGIAETATRGEHDRLRGRDRPTTAAERLAGFKKWHENQKARGAA